MAKHGEAPPDLSVVGRSTAGERLSPCEEPATLIDASHLSTADLPLAHGVGPAPHGSAERLSALVMAALATGFAHVAGRMRRQILFADLYEDDDLAPATHGLDAADDVSTAHVLALLSDAESSLLAAGASSDDAAAATPGEAASASSTASSAPDSTLEACLRGIRALAHDCEAYAGVSAAEATPTAGAAGLLLPATLVVGGPADPLAEGGPALPRLGAIWAAGGAAALRAMPERSVVYCASRSGAPITEELPAEQVAAMETAEAAIDAAMTASAALPRSAPSAEEIAWAEDGAASLLIPRLRWLRATIGSSFLFRRALESTPADEAPSPGAGLCVPVDPSTLEDDVARVQSALLQAAAGASLCANEWLRQITPTLPDPAAAAAPDAATDTTSALGRMRVRGEGADSSLVATPPGAFDRTVLDCILGVSQPRYLACGPVHEAAERARRQAASLAIVCCSRVFATCDEAAVTGEMARLGTLPRHAAGMSEAAMSRADEATALALAQIASTSSFLSPPLGAHEAVFGKDGLRRISLSGLWDMTSVLRAGGRGSFDVVVRSRLFTLLLPRGRASKIFGVRDPRSVVEAALLDRGISQAELQQSLTAQVVSLAAGRIPYLVRLMCMADARMHRSLDLVISDWARVQGDAWQVDCLPPDARGGPATVEELAVGTSALGAAAVSALRPAPGRGKRKGGAKPERSTAAGSLVGTPEDVTAQDRPMLVHLSIQVLLRLQAASLDLALRLDLVHDDDAVALTWYQDYLATMKEMYADAGAKAQARGLRAALDRKPAAKGKTGKSGKPGKGKPGKGKAAKSKPAAETSAPLPGDSVPSTVTRTMLTCRRDAARLSFMVAAVMARKGLMPGPAAGDDETWDLRFQERFSQILRSHDPAPLSWDQFSASFDSDAVDVGRSLNSADETVRQCHQRLTLCHRAATAELEAVAEGRPLLPPHQADMTRRMVAEAPAQVKDALSELVQRTPLFGRMASGDVLGDPSDAGAVPLALSAWQELLIAVEMKPMMKAMRSTALSLSRLRDDADSKAAWTLRPMTHPCVPVPYCE